MTTTSVLAVPGIGKVDGIFLRELGALADRHGWDVDGIAGVISHESGFNPAAKNPQPGQTATGLIQFTEATARSLGTSTAALRAMTGVQQLSYVEGFFAKTLHPIPQDPADYILATYGRSDLIGQSDATVIDRADSPDPREAQRYRVNSALDKTKKGFITVGDLRSSLWSVLAAAGGKRIQIVQSGDFVVAPTAQRNSSVVFVVAAAAALAAAAAYTAKQRRIIWQS